MFDFSQLDVCFMAGTLGQGGAERQLFYIIKTLRENGARVRLLCLTQGDFWESRIEELGIKVTWVGQRDSRVRRLVSIISALRKDPPQILQSQHFYTNLYAAMASRVLGIRDIGAMRSNGVSEVKANGSVMGRLSLRIPTFIAANSKVAIVNARALGMKGHRLHLLPNVVDTEQFKPSNRITNGSVRLLSAGRLGPEKRVDRFISIVAELRMRTSLKVRAVIAGDGPLRRQLENHAAELGLLADSVDFLGAVPDMTSVYQEADILVMTSDWEGTPNVALEAMASGIPVVTTRVGGTQEIVRHGETGYLCDSTNETMSESLLDLIIKPDLRHKMGRHARRYVVSNHSPSGLLSSLEDLYKAALA